MGVGSPGVFPGNAAKRAPHWGFFFRPNIRRGLLVFKGGFMGSKDVTIGWEAIKGGPKGGD